MKLDLNKLVLSLLVLSACGASEIEAEQEDSESGASVDGGASPGDSNKKDPDGNDEPSGGDPSGEADTPNEEDPSKQDPESEGGSVDEDSESEKDSPKEDPESGNDDPDEPEPDEGKAPSGAYVTANIDDDNKNGTADFKEAFFAQDNDIAPWKIPSAPKGEVMTFKFSGDLKNLKIWKDGKDWMGQGQGQVKSEFEYTSTGDPLELQVEMGDYNAKAKLSVSSKSRGSQDYDLLASPLILNHHLQTFEKVWIVRSPQSAPTVSGFQKALGSKLGVLSASSYGNDIWLQDEIEFGTMTGMNGAQINVVLDSIRNRGLDAFPERELTTDQGRTKDWVLGVWGRGRATSGDSFGNLETTPPTKEYPLGRIYYGNRANGKLNTELANFLDAQEIQKPFGFDTSWLCVSHVDEILTFVPAPSAPRGFLMLFGDTRAGYKMLESMDAGAPLSHYRYKTVGEMRNSRALRDRNEEIQQDALDPTLARFKKELDLKDEEIILVPALYHDVTGCKGPETAAALIPGTVNMVVLPGAKGEKTKLIIPDPFFRASGASQSQDAFIKYFDDMLPDSFETHYVDDWDAYHAKHGEVHCASNVKRPPAGPWWPKE